jgi:hypothetical protein
MSHLPVRGIAVVLAAVAMIAITPVTATATSLSSTVTPSLSNAPTDSSVIETNGCLVGYKRTSVRTDCIYGDPYGTKKVALVGDSHAAHLFAPLNAIAKARHWKLNIQTKISCRFVDLPIWSRQYDVEYTQCETWRKNVVSYLRAHPQDMVIYVVARGMAVLPDRPEDDDPTTQGHALAQLMKQIPGRQRIIVDTPTSYHDVPKCLSAHKSNIEACATSWSLAVSWRYLKLENAAHNDTGAPLINLSHQICPADPCMPVVNNMIVYRDFMHLTKTFAKSLKTRLAYKLPLL